MELVELVEEEGVVRATLTMTREEYVDFLEKMVRHNRRR